MAVSNFPFPSLNGDNVYGSSDFRNLLSSLIGNGRCSLGTILPENSLKSTLDSLNVDTIFLSSGAVMVNGGYHGEDSQTQYEIVLPTDSSTQTWYILARIDANINRNITILATQTYIPTSDFILCTITATSVGIQTCIDSTDVAYLRNVSMGIERIQMFDNETDARNAPEGVLALFPFVELGGD